MRIELPLVWIVVLNVADDADRTVTLRRRDGHYKISSAELAVLIERGFVVEDDYRYEEGRA